MNRESFITLLKGMNQKLESKQYKTLLEAAEKLPEEEKYCLYDILYVEMHTLKNGDGKVDRVICAPQQMKIKILTKELSGEPLIKESSDFYSPISLQSLLLYLPEQYKDIVSKKIKRVEELDKNCLYVGESLLLKITNN